MLQVTENFLGRGLKFPIQIDKGTGGFACSAGPVPYYTPGIAEDLEKIRGSIEHILTTPVGTRYYNPTFGSNLRSLVFEPNDLILPDLIRVNTVEALELWEPRVNVLGIDIRQDEFMETKLLCNIYYQIIKYNIEDNLVYPFVREF